MELAATAGNGWVLVESVRALNPWNLRVEVQPALAPACSLAGCSPWDASAAGIRLA